MITRKSALGTLTGITAVCLAVVVGTAHTGSANTATVRPVGDCKRVAAADVKVCNAVLTQHAYGKINNGGGSWSAPNGRVIVKDITHQGLTKIEMGDYLRAERRNYVDNVTAVKVNMDKLRSSDCQWIISLVDEDHKPGGRKLTKITQDCP